MENFPSLEGVSSGKNQQNTRKEPQMAMKIHQIFPFVKFFCRQSILLLYYYISHYTNVYRKLERCL